MRRSTKRRTAKRTLPRVIAYSVIFAVVLIVIIVASIPKPMSDVDLIDQQLTVARDQADNKSAEGVMSIVSQDYHDPQNNNRTQLGLMITQAMLNAQFVSVQLSTIKTIVSGDSATTVCNVTVKADDETRFNGPLTLVWEKTTARHDIFFTENVWQVVSASSTSDLPAAD